MPFSCIAGFIAVALQDVSDSYLIAIHLDVISVGAVGVRLAPAGKAATGRLAHCAVGKEIMENSTFFGNRIDMWCLYEDFPIVRRPGQLLCVDTESPAA